MASNSLNAAGALRVVQASPMLTEMVKYGATYAFLGAATAALTAVPGTTAGHSLWNGESDGGKSYIIDSFGTLEIVVDATQSNSIALFALLNKGRQASITDAGLTRASFSGESYSGLARTAAGGTVVDEGWQPFGPATPQGGSALAGNIWRVVEAKVNGLYLVKPGHLFSIACAKAAATASQIRYFIRWHEVQIDDAE